MNLAAALLVGYLLGSGAAVDMVEQGITESVRDSLGLPPECKIVTTVHLNSRGSLATGMVEVAKVDMDGVDLDSLQWASGGAPSAEGNLRGRIGEVRVTLHWAVTEGFVIERLTFLIDRWRAFGDVCGRMSDGGSS
jgi:hypothetical protein